MSSPRDVGPRMLALVPGLVIGLALIWSTSVEVAGRRLFALSDDALISMAYARTWAETGELVWYPGADRVEGFTNPGYVMLMWIPHALGVDASTATLSMALVGLGAVLGCAYVAGGIAGTLVPLRRVIVLTTIVISCSFSLLMWSVLGLEVGVVALLLMLVVALAVRLKSGGGVGTVVSMAVVVVIGVMVRPDFAVVGVVLVVWTVALDPEGLPGRRVPGVILGGSLLGILLVVSGARWLYYGELTPTTYVLKMSGSTVPERISRALSASPELVAYAALALVATVILWRLGVSRELVTLLLALTLAQVGYVAYVGADAFSPDRFLTPAAVTTSILVICAAGAMTRGRGRVLQGGAILVASVTLLGLSAGDEAFGYRGWWNGFLPSVTHELILTGTDVAMWTTADAVIAVTSAGAVPYWSGRPAIDLLGKSDRFVAAGPRRKAFNPGHDKWDYGHSILAEAPDVVDPTVLSGYFAGDAEEIRWIEQRYVLSCSPGGSEYLIRRDSDAIDREVMRPC